MENSANVRSMAVTLTLVFSDESHREAWMRRMGILDIPGRRSDYEARRSNTDLTYLVGAEQPHREGI